MSATPPAMSALPSITAAIERAATLLATDPARAEREAKEIQRTLPNDPRIMLILASARRRQGDPETARALLAPLAKAHPRAARTHYELGVALSDLGERPSAIAALSHAVAVNRELPEAWRALGEQLFAEGDMRAADRAFAEHARASVREPALRGAADAIFEGRLSLAETLLRDRAKAFPTESATLRMLAEVFIRLERHGDAEILSARCLELDPGDDGARFIHADALFRQQKAVQALTHLERLVARAPKDPAYRNMMAACLGLIGEDARVNEIQEGLLADYPRQPKIWLNHGHALKTVGRLPEAVAAYRRCLSLAPWFADAYWGLANLKVARFTEAEVACMRTQLAKPDLPGEDRLHLHYALGRAYEDRGVPAAAFANYAEGAKLRRAKAAYDAAAAIGQMLRAKAFFSEDFFAARAGGGSRSDAPLFIVGLPRSGSTLVEQILASHSAVEGIMELPNIRWIAGELGAPDRYPECLAGIESISFRTFGDAYIDATRIHRKLDRPFFIDKMPNNFHHIGLIHLILPNSKIIDVRRHPMATCFSAFKQHFAQGQAFSYDLGDLGRYYRDYIELMAHFDDVLPRRVHRVIYEDLVNDVEGEIRGLLNYCGLPFEAACLNFHANNRAVRTVSSEQVRRPISREGLDHWHRFEPWLDPLRAALGPALNDWRG
jgi:tetratricopeptide (TPR) repeat protein